MNKIILQNEFFERELADMRKVYTLRTFLFTNGCFDFLHVGHIRLLRHAKHCLKVLNPVVIVGLNDDDSIRKAKGPGRPVFPLTERLELLTALEYVDHVIPFFGDDALLPLIKKVRPGILLKGADWHGKIVGKEFVESYGGTVLEFPIIEGRSTTDIIARIRGENA